jgi:hypothetical protein
MIEFQIPTRGHIYGGKPSVPKAELAIRFTKAVGHHGKQGSFIGSSQVLLPADCGDQLINAEFVPQGLGKEWDTILIRTVYLEIEG